MYLELALLAALLAPQQPSSAERSQTPPQRFAAVLPAKTLAVLGWSDVGPRIDELRQTAVADLLSALPLEGANAERGLAAIDRRLGLPEGTVTRVLQRGGAVALTGMSSSRKPLGMMVVRLGDDADAVAEALDRLAAKGVLESRAAGSRTWLMAGIDGMRPALAVDGDDLLLATGREELDGAIERRLKHGDSLADAPGFAAFTQNAGDAMPLVWAFVQTQPLVELTASTMDGRDREQARKVLESVGLDRVDHVSYALTLQQQAFVDRVRIGWPVPRGNLVTALLGEGSRLRPERVRLVPPGVSGFALGSLDLAKIVDEALALADRVRPGSSAMARMGLDRLQQSTGVDLRQDLLGSLGSELVSLQWNRDDDVPATAVVWQLRDGDRVQRSLARLIGLTGVQPTTRTVAGTEVHSLQAPGGAFTLSYAVAGDRLVVATTDEALRATIDQLGHPQDNEAAAKLMQQLPAGTTWAATTDLQALGRSLLTAMERASSQTSLPPRAMTTLTALVDRLHGSCDSWLTTDADGVTVSSRSPIGNVYAWLAGGVALSTAVPTLLQNEHLAATVLGDLDAGADDTLVPSLVVRISDAEREYRRLNARYATLPELASAGAIPASALGQPAAGDAFRSGPYLLRVLLPDDADQRSEQFAVVAWPADEQTGAVLGALPDQPLLVNHVIASSVGMRTVEPADVFSSGEFGTELVSGWRALSIDAERVGAAAHDRDLLEAVQTAEAAGVAEVPDTVLEALRARTPAVAARAAWVLGKLGVKRAVPELAELVTGHADASVRRQAMAALSRLRDPRGVDAAVVALTDDDLLVRALAAESLGRLRVRRSIDDLLVLVAREGDDDTRDRQAALLALADIGAESALLPAAAGVVFADPGLGTALTYLFQTVSPQLAPEEEAKALMAVLGHPSPLLRRYAIQRLGQLRAASSVKALEGRLAAEEDEGLRQLIEIALRAVRNTTVAEETTPAAGQDLKTRVMALWQQMTPQVRGLVAGGGGALVVLLGALLVWRARRRRAAAAEQWAAMTAPSEGFEPQEGYEEYEEYADDGDYEPTDVTEVEDLETDWDEEEAAAYGSSDRLSHR